MTLATHAIVGAGIATLVPQYPAIALVSAFASHFLLDAIPHYDYPIHSATVDPQIEASFKFDKHLAIDAVSIGTDALVGVALATLLFPIAGFTWLVVASACAAILPDALQFVYGHFKPKPLVKLQRFHEWIHTDQRLKNHPLLGVLSQILFVIIFVAIIKYFLN